MESARGQIVIQPYLLPQERVLWLGQPRQGILLSPADIFLIPFSLLWGGFAIFWNVAVWSFPADGPDLFFKLWGLPFFVVGLYIMFGRFLHDAAIRRNLTYAVTDQRVIALSSSGKFRSLDITRLPALELNEHRDGSGTISFDPTPAFFGWGSYGGWGPWLPSSGAGVRFFKIERARQIYSMINDQSARTASV